MISSDWQYQIFENQFGGSKLVPTGLNQAENEILGHFIEFGS